MTLFWLLTLLVLAPALIILIWLLLSPRPTSIVLNSRHVLITGGSSGIGLAMAQIAAVEGARVSIVGRDIEKLSSARQSILNYYQENYPATVSAPHVNFISGDVKVFQSIEKALDEAVAKSGPLDVLICSHGVAVPQTFEDTTLETMYHMLDTNLKGNLHTVKAALPHMMKRGSTSPGSISMVSSQAGQVSLYGFAAYSASKYGLRGFAEALQQELLPHNIRMSLIYPPDTKTPGFLEENKTKPELTYKLSETSGGMEPLDVAKVAIRGLKAGQFNISCNFDGLLLSAVTAGMSPQTSLPHALLEIFFMGLLRFVALFIVSGWNKTVLDWHRSQKK